MADKKTIIAPFAYDTDYYIYTDREEAEKKKFVSFMTQRNAQYREAAEEVYNNKHLEDKELMWEAFRDNIEPPTPQLQRIDGYDSEEECSDGGEEGDGGNDNGGDDNNENPTEPTEPSDDENNG